jgi:hypothetical protein
MIDKGELQLLVLNNTRHINYLLLKMAEFDSPLLLFFIADGFDSNEISANNLTFSIFLVLAVIS